MGMTVYLCPHRVETGNGQRRIDKAPPTGLCPPAAASIFQQLLGLLNRTHVYVGIATVAITLLHIALTGVPMGTLFFPAVVVLVLWQGLCGMFLTWRNSPKELKKLLLVRFFQGVGAGAPSVIAVSLARDAYTGRQPGRVLSLAMMIFMAVPILAPSIGQLILQLAPWRWTFGVLVTGGAVVLLWSIFRLQESLPLELRHPLPSSAVVGG